MGYVIFLMLILSTSSLSEPALTDWGDSMLRSAALRIYTEAHSIPTTGNSPIAPGIEMNTVTRVAPAISEGLLVNTEGKCT